MQKLITSKTTSWSKAIKGMIHSLVWDSKLILIKIFVVDWIFLCIIEMLISLVGTPAAQEHDSSQRFLWLLGFLILQFGWRRKLVVGMRQRSQVMFSMLLCWSYNTVPSAYSLILQCLHHSNTCCYTPCPCSASWTHCITYYWKEIVVLTNLMCLILINCWWGSSDVENKLRL